MNCNENRGLQLSRQTAMSPLLFVEFPFFNFVPPPPSRPVPPSVLDCHPCNSHIKMSLLAKRFSEIKNCAAVFLLGNRSAIPFSEISDGSPGKCWDNIIKWPAVTCASSSALFSSYRLHPYYKFS